jgi:hypothetical protein
LRGEVAEERPCASASRRAGWAPQAHGGTRRGHAAAMRAPNGRSLVTDGRAVVRAQEHMDLVLDSLPVRCRYHSRGQCLGPERDVRLPKRGVGLPVRNTASHSDRSRRGSISPAAARSPYRPALSVRSQIAATARRVPAATTACCGRQHNMARASSRRQRSRLATQDDDVTRALVADHLIPSGLNANTPHDRHGRGHRGAAHTRTRTRARTRTHTFGMRAVQSSSGYSFVHTCHRAATSPMREDARPCACEQARLLCAHACACTHV